MVERAKGGALQHERCAGARVKKDAIFRFFATLAELNPEPETELEFGNHYQLLVAVVLSAQATDVWPTRRRGHCSPMSPRPRRCWRWAKRG